MHNCVILFDIKIIEYSEKYSKEINDFINWSMYNFIGRKFKQREDLIDINEYYIKNGGNFWIAIYKNKIIGTIALENRNKFGILKRFYVDKDFQRIGIGSMLYDKLEIYAKNKTNIKTLYLACGKFLKNAHKFYNKKGLKQINAMEIEMHFAIDDDFFKKEL